MFQGSPIVVDLVGADAEGIDRVGCRNYVAVMKDVGFEEVLELAKEGWGVDNPGGAPGGSNSRREDMSCERPVVEVWLGI